MNKETGREGFGPSRIRQGVFRPTKALARILLTPFFSLEREGDANLPHREAFLLLPKHQRWEDIPLLSLASPRPLHYVAKVELFKNGFGRWFLRSLGGIPLNRERPLESRRHLREMLGVMNAGEGVVVFPEGTYYPQRVGPGQVGLVRLILSRVNLPFIPVGIRYEKTRARTRVRVRFGRPIQGNPAAYPKAFINHVMNEIAELSGLGACPEREGQGL